MSELKACPFCGGEAALTTPHGAPHFIACLDEDCPGYNCMAQDADEWNRRAVAGGEVERAAMALVNRIEAEGGKGYEIHDLARALRVALATPAEAKEERG